MSKLLKKDGKLVKKNGKLVKSTDPANCPCCGTIDFCVNVAGVQIINGQFGWNYRTTEPCEPCFPDCVEKDAPAWQLSESDCNAHREADCPPAKYICAIRSPCSLLPLRSGRWSWLADGRWIVGDDGCQRTPPLGTCTIADPPSRPGAYEGETVSVGCKEVTPSTTKECITEEEFNKGGWIKVSGPHDTLQLCEAACNPPPPPTGCVACDNLTNGSISYYPYTCPEGSGQEDFCQSREDARNRCLADGGSVITAAAQCPTVPKLNDNPLP